MEDELGCSVRSYAIAGLVTYGLTAVLVALTLKYPRFGNQPHQYGEALRLPPQAFLAFLLGLFTFGISVMIGLTCLRFSIASRRWVWLSVLSLSILAELLGPAFLFIPPRFSPSAWNPIALISALGVLLTLVASLLYSARSPSA